ncbi:hypothetical protein CK203_064335 [Vitis vinifera]|uniref:Aspartic peptidase DDI1-type domain-containing protein n=1 Tax=Vitis vinifera TaxID=29760 RepID=A0A438GWF4_VITVI|nr:hypothetical protein CK203_064335 [Vitis vinifera]
MMRRLEELELKKIHEVQVVGETPVQVKPCPIFQSYEHLVEECPTIPVAREMFGDQTNVIGQFKPNNNALYGNTYNSNWRNHPNFSWKPRAPQVEMKKLEPLEANHTKLKANFVGCEISLWLQNGDLQLAKFHSHLACLRNPQGKSKVNDHLEWQMLGERHEPLQDESEKIQVTGALFLHEEPDPSDPKTPRSAFLYKAKNQGTPTRHAITSQPHQNPKGIHEVETHEGESSQVRDFKALINLRSGKKVKVNIPLLDMIKQVPTYAKFLKDLCTIKRGLNVNKKAFLTKQVSAIIQCKSPLKYKYSGCPTILVMIGGKVVEKALLDLGASVNLLPYYVYKQLGLGELKPTSITLSLADRSVKIPRGIIEDVLVQVDNFYYPVDFVVLDTDPIVKETNYVLIILGRSFLACYINCNHKL